MIYVCDDVVILVLVNFNKFYFRTVMGCCPIFKKKEVSPEPHEITNITINPLH